MPCVKIDYSQALTDKLILMLRNTLSYLLSISVFCTITFPTIVKSQTKSTTSEYTKCWTYADSDTSFERVITDEGVVFTAGSGGRIVSIELAKGKKLWTTDLGGEIVSNLAMDSGSLYVATRSIKRDQAKSGGTNLRVLSKDTGVTLWTAAIDGTGAISLTVEGGVIVAAARSGEIAGIGIKETRLNWKFAITGGISATPQFAKGLLTIATKEKHIVGVSIATGETKFNISVPTAATAVRMSNDLDVIYGDARGRLVSISTASRRENWKFRCGGQVANIIVSGEELIVSSFDNFVYKINFSTGQVDWKRRMPSRIAGSSVLPDLKALFLSADNDTGMIIDLKNGKTTTQLSLKSPASGVDIPEIGHENIVLVSSGGVHAYFSKPCKM